MAFLTIRVSSGPYP